MYWDSKPKSMQRRCQSPPRPRLCGPRLFRKSLRKTNSFLVIFNPEKYWVKLYIPFKTPIRSGWKSSNIFFSCHLGMEKRFKIHALHRAWGLAASYPKDLSPSWAIFTRTPCPCGPCKGKEGSRMKLLCDTLGNFWHRLRNDQAAGRISENTTVRQSPKSLQWFWEQEVSGGYAKSWKQIWQCWNVFSNR